MPVSKKQMDSVQKYRSSHYYRIPVNILLENRDIVRRAAEERGVSLNVYINSLIQIRNYLEPPQDMLDIAMGDN